MKKTIRHFVPGALGLSLLVAEAQDHDGNCGGGFVLSAGTSVAKKDTSDFFHCSDDIYIVGLGHRSVQDNGHVIDTPDVFNGEGNSSLNVGHGQRQVFVLP